MNKYRWILDNPSIVENLKFYIAGSNLASIKNLKYLSEDKSNIVREVVAANSRTPKRILTRLSTEEDNWIKIAVAKNPNTLKSILNQFSNAKEFWLRKYVSENPNAPISILEKLSSDNNEVVRMAATRGLEGRIF